MSVGRRPHEVGVAKLVAAADVVLRYRLPETARRRPPGVKGEGTFIHIEDEAVVDCGVKLIFPLNFGHFVFILNATCANTSRNLLLLLLQPAGDRDDFPSFLNLG